MTQEEKTAEQQKLQKEMVQRWNDEAEARLVGRRIVSARYMSKDELCIMGWNHCHSGSIVFRLDNGTVVFPSTDDEGNGPGALMLQTPTGFHTLPVVPAI